MNVETIRYYEREGILPEPPRTASGYRQYSDVDRWRLAFIRRGKGLGFTLREIAELLGAGEERSVPEVRDVAENRLTLVDRDLAELTRTCTSSAGSSRPRPKGARPPPWVGPARFSSPPGSARPLTPGMAEGVGFEPTVSCPTHAFQACRFGRSRIPPYEPADGCTEPDVGAVDRSGDAPATLRKRTVLGGEPVVPCTPNPRYGGLNPRSRPEPPLGRRLASGVDGRVLRNGIS